MLTLPSNQAQVYYVIWPIDAVAWERRFNSPGQFLNNQQIAVRRSLAISGGFDLVVAWEHAESISP
ncbi:MAG: hypothetical protein C0456_06005 [Hyphomonas sp.]|nr:hypothetical protein [Hyphomonas sp.]